MKSMIRKTIFSSVAADRIGQLFAGRLRRALRFFKQTKNNNYESRDIFNRTRYLLAAI